MKFSIKFILTIFWTIQLEYENYAAARKLISSAIRTSANEEHTFKSLPVFNESTRIVPTTNMRRDVTRIKSLHRLVGGHLHHSVYKQGDKAISSQLISTTTTTPPSPFVLLKTNIAQSIATVKNEAPLAPAGTSVEPSTTKESVFIVEAKSIHLSEPTKTSEAVKIERLIESSAGEGKNQKKNDELKKTLSDQVAEGKYGLIQNELFKTSQKRPGILSYATNPDTPSDNSDNLGGLTQKDIWLAEDHLLVLKGGNLNNDANDEPWKPIDDYKAPLHQVKIPSNPQVAPPFPVQFKENGPIEFLENNQLPPLFNPFTNESVLLFPDRGFPPKQTYGADKTHTYALPGKTDDFKNVSLPSAVYGWNSPFINFGHEMPPLVPSNVLRPNGSLDNLNLTDIFDEDDPSFFYPPPYSFVYKINYSSPVEPGPLVPGIIIPPPPNFFGALEESLEKITQTPKLSNNFQQRPSKQTIKPSYKPVTTTSMPIRDNGTEKTKLFKEIERIRGENIHYNEHSPITIVPLIAKAVPTKIKHYKEAINNAHNQTKSKPIYYEFFDARIKSNVRAPVYTTTPSTKSSLGTQQHPSTKLSSQRPYNAYLPVKPEINKEKYTMTNQKSVEKPDSNLPNVHIDGNKALSTRKPIPAKIYNSEIENIRHTIEFFKHQEKQKEHNDSVPRNPKTQAVYEYSFDAISGKVNNKLFHPSAFDSIPFRPMVKYSAPLNTENDFKAIVYTTIPTVSKETKATISTKQSVKDIFSNLEFIPHANVPKNPSVQFIPVDPSVLKSISLKTTGYSTIKPTQFPLYSISPWITVEKQVLREVLPKEINVQIQSPTPTLRPLHMQEAIKPPNSYYSNINIDGTFNSNFYPVRTPIYFQKRPVMTAQQNAYLQQIEAIRNHLDQTTNHYFIGNKSDHNYKVIKPLIPSNGIIASYQLDSQQYPHLSQILSPNYNLRPQQQRFSRVYHPLHRDVLVNYKYPLPPNDPNSEILPPPHLLHPLSPLPLTQPIPKQFKFEPVKRNPTLIQYKLPGDQNAKVFFYTPHDEKLNDMVPKSY